MTSTFPLPPTDPVDEDALRETLRRHAPVLVHAEAAWAAVSPRLAAPHRAAVHSRHAWLSRLRRPRIAVALAFAVLLTGAGAAGGHYLWGWPFGSSKAWVIGDGNLYSQIDQTQTVAGVTITMIEGYADPGNTYLAYSIQMSPALRQRYTSVIIATADVTDRLGDEPQGANTLCQAAPADGGPQYCLMDMTAFAPPPDATQLALTVDVSAIYAFDATHARTDTLTGPWRFAFILPWHARSLGPGGPYAQPIGTSTPRTAPASTTPPMR
jgi:hypothetical protein